MKVIRRESLTFVFLNDHDAEPVLSLTPPDTLLLHRLLAESEQLECAADYCPECGYPLNENYDCNECGCAD